MSGHSKWATIKHQKAAKDKTRGKVFAKLIRQVEVAAREGRHESGKRSGHGAQCSASLAPSSDFSAKAPAVTTVMPGRKPSVISARPAARRPFCYRRIQHYASVFVPRLSS